MGRLATCKLCGKKLKKEERFTYSNKSYCEECYEKVSRGTNNSKDYKTLMGYICELYDIKKPTGLMLKQVKEFKNELNYSYSGMGYTLWYCKEVLGLEFIEKFGIAVIKYNYESAKKYYEDQERLCNHMEQLKDVEVKVRRVIRKTSKNDEKKGLIDLSTL